MPHGIIHEMSSVFVKSSCSVAFGLKGDSSRWAAHRIRAEHETKFDAVKAVKENQLVHFTGEVGQIPISYS